MRVFVFGSGSLTWRHLATVQGFLKDSLELLPEGESIILTHEDRLPSAKAPGAIGASKLSEVAAMLVWPADRRRVFRTANFTRYKLDQAFCFHTDAGIGETSTATARVLQTNKIPFLLVVLKENGDLALVEER